MHRRISVILIGLLMFGAAANAQSAKWNGTWLGKWGGVSDATIVIESGEVVEYRFKGRSFPTGKTVATKDTLRFGNNVYTVIMRLKGRSRLEANWTNNRGGKSFAVFRRK